MGKIIVPKPNARERAAFAKGNVTLIDAISETDFLKVAEDFISAHNVLNLATCKNNVPRCTPLEYFNNGLAVHVCSEGGGKIANLKANPTVAYSIHDPYDPGTDFFGAHGMQVWGTATMFRKNDDIERFRDIFAYSRHKSDLERQGVMETAEQFNFNVISIVPVKIRYLCHRKGFRNVIWMKE